MKVRLTAKPKHVGSASQFNPSALFEVIVTYPDGDMDSVEGKELDVQLGDGTWLSLRQAFAERLVIADDYNQRFREPANDLEQQRGWF